MAPPRPILIVLTICSLAISPLLSGRFSPLLLVDYREVESTISPRSESYKKRADFRSEADRKLQSTPSPTFSPNAAPTSAPTSDSPPETDLLLTLRTTFKAYGTIFAILFLSFCFVRPRFPSAYNVRSSVPELGCGSARDPHYAGHFLWFFRIFSISNDELFDQCTLDACVFIRTLQLGFKVSLVGIFNSLWLMPLFATAGHDETDSFPTLGMIQAGSNRLYGVVLASYILFGFTKYFILREFEWFTEYRHKFLSRSRPANYTVLVEGIPPKYQSRGSLFGYFSSLFSEDRVLDVEITRDIPELEEQVKKREKIVKNLEHAINIRNVKGIRPTHLTAFGEKVDSIENYSAKLTELNRTVGEAIHRLEDGPIRNSISESDPSPEGDSTGSPVNYMQQMKSTVMSIVAPGEDGKCRDAGFVSFNDLVTATSALQIVHNVHPYSMRTTSSPMPEDVNWRNVGLDHKQQQGGKLMGFGAALALCLFWTVPMAFVAALSNADALTERLPFLKTWTDNSPGFKTLLDQIAPLILVGFVNALPVIMRLIVKVERHVGVPREQASLFRKLAVFAIIQTFFVPAIAGGLLVAINELINDPLNQIVSLLSESLPKQAGFFMQYVLVRVFLGLGLELLRVTAVTFAFLRRFIGPNLTEKERSTPFLTILRPLSDPEEFQHAKYLTEIVLYFVILLVYASISPVTCYILAFAFGLQWVGYMHQFIFIYPPTHDTGGKLWPALMKFIILCMAIAELTVFGLLGLKEGAIQASLTFPLMIGTLLFHLYLGQRHYRITKYLSACECIDIDTENITNGTDLSVIKGQYVQPALKCKKLLPDNFVPDDDHSGRARSFSGDGSGSMIKNIDSRSQGEGTARSDIAMAGEEKMAEGGEREHPQAPTPPEQNNMEVPLIS